MKYVSLFENFKKEIIEGIEVANFYKGIGSRHGFDEDLYEDLSTKKFIYVNMNINDILENDADVKYFVDHSVDEIDYDYDEVYGENDKNGYFDEPIIIGSSYNEENIVLDGYHRLTEHIRRGLDRIDVYKEI